MLPIKTTISFIVFCSLFFAPPSVSASNDLLKMLYLKEKKTKEKDEGINLSGEFGVLAANGNTNTTTFKAALRSEHETTHWSNNYGGEITYKQNEVDNDIIVSAQRLFLNAQLDYKLPAKNKRLFVYAEYEDDRFNGFRYQSALATGWSAHAWKEENSQLRYSIGPGYSYSEREVVDAENHTSYDILKEVIVRASLDYRFSFNKNAKFRQFLSTEAGQESNRSRSETSITANLVETLAMKLSFVMSYNDGTLQQNEDLSTETSISLVYQFF
jgi:putative salt-induced outer membrane protein YdiY